MKLAVTIDVEEEGLFNGQYLSGHRPVTNVAELPVLDSVIQNSGIRPTLLVSYQVVREKSNQDLLLTLRDKWDAEIGAHLHPWNTPPIESLPYPEPVPSELMPRRLLSEKLATLLEAIQGMGVMPVSFRMGRFNLGPKMLSVLQETGIRVDSSIAPMRKNYGGPTHLDAPSDPYFPDPADPCSVGTSRILEVPITVLPYIPRTGLFLERLERRNVIPQSWISWFAMHIASIHTQPGWLGLNRLKAGAKLHRSRGGQILTLFFHSSELVPGCSPLHSTAKDIRRFLAKLELYLAWLRKEMNAESVTLSELYEIYQREAQLGPVTDHGSIQ